MTGKFFEGQKTLVDCWRILARVGLIRETHALALLKRWSGLETLREAGMEGGSRGRDKGEWAREGEPGRRRKEKEKGVIVVCVIKERENSEGVLCGVRVCVCAYVCMCVCLCVCVCVCVCV